MGKPKQVVVRGAEPEVLMGLTHSLVTIGWLASIEDSDDALRAGVDDLKRRVRLARARIAKSYAPPSMAVAAWLQDVYDLLDLRKPLPRRKR